MVLPSVLALFVTVIRDVFQEFAHIAAIILGGLVVWVGVILARWLAGGCSFRSRGGRRR